MKAWRMHGVGQVRLDDVPEPEAGPGEVLIRPRYTGVCSTDLHVLYAGAFHPALPLTMGHEFSGVVVALGPEVVFDDRYPQSRPLQVGDRVCVEPVLPCNRCYYCLRGQTNLCPQMSHLGIWQAGSLAELVRAPAVRCTRLPDTLTDQEGALTEVLACGVNFVEKGGVQAGDCVVVVGGGPMGQMAAMVAGAAGASRIIVSELSPERRAVAERMGAQVTVAAERDDPVAAVRALTGGRGADVALECVGVEKSVQQALDMTRRGGRCVLGGLPVAPLRLEMQEVVFGEKQVVGALASAWQFGKALDLISSRRLNPAGIISREYAFDEAAEALATAHTDRTLCKLMIKQF
jgi:2-desacetyl-2-hydroxyethyl bacteriochlorophyllide A dehydrogenase